ncbi:MAG: helix-turn-helix domain-containing protein [Armatimonadetes bacterium]|nr:helix-turn-helix domain-containing protein [Armatimonadota bacterium]
MLKHDWMRKRDRRTRRFGQDGLSEQDDRLFDEEASLDAVLGLGEDDHAEVALEQEPWPTEVAATWETDSSATDAAGEDAAEVPHANVAADSEDAMTPWPEDVLADQDEAPEPASDDEAENEEMEAPTVAAEPPAPEQVEPAPPRDDVRAVVERLDVPVQSLRDRLEQVLARQAQLPLDIEARQEVSEKAASSPRERRDELVQRLLDPTLNLHEAAVLLGVCRTTVRRYTDRGLLRCFRTPGNQRRFNLSDILDFMERQQRGEI